MRVTVIHDNFCNCSRDEGISLLHQPRVSITDSYVQDFLSTVLTCSPSHVLLSLNYKLYSPPSAPSVSSSNETFFHNLIKYTHTHTHMSSFSAPTSVETAPGFHWESAFIREIPNPTLRISINVVRCGKEVVSKHHPLPTATRCNTLQRTTTHCYTSRVFHLHSCAAWAWRFSPFLTIPEKTPVVHLVKVPPQLWKTACANVFEAWREEPYICIIVLLVGFHRPLFRLWHARWCTILQAPV